MFVRLREMGYVEYERYRGVSLTERGHEEALRLVRRHRLIETFLLEHLGYSWGEVHGRPSDSSTRSRTSSRSACRSSWGILARTPGDPIPAADGTMQPDHSFPLSEAAPGQRVCISKVGDKPSTLDYLGEHGLVPGRLLSVREVRDLDGVVIGGRGRGVPRPRRTARARGLRPGRRGMTRGWRRDGYLISTDASMLDLEVVHGYLSRSYWAAGVPEDVVRRSIENSLCFGVYRG